MYPVVSPIAEFPPIPLKIPQYVYNPFLSRRSSQCTRLEGEDEIAEIIEIVSTEPWEVMMRLKCSEGLLV